MSLWLVTLGFTLGPTIIPPHQGYYEEEENYDYCQNYNHDQRSSGEAFRLLLSFYFVSCELRLRVRLPTVSGTQGRR